MKKGFTLIEVLMATFILVLFPTGALITTLRLEWHARLKAEEMAAAAFCEDVYNRCIREENLTGVSWKTLSNTTKEGQYDRWYAKIGASLNAAGSSVDNKIYLPTVCMKDGTFYTPIRRDTNYRKPQYRIVVNKDTKDVRVSLRWGPTSESYRYYHK